MKPALQNLTADKGPKLPSSVVNTRALGVSYGQRAAGAWQNLVGRSLLRNVSALTIAGVVGAAITLGQGIVVARWLQPDLYGIAILIMSFPNLIYGVVDARSGDVSVKYLSEAYIEKDRERSLAICKFGYAIDLLFAMIVFVAVVLTAPWAAATFVKDAAVETLIIVTAAAFVPAALVRTSQAAMTSAGRFDLLSWTDLATKIVRALVILVFVFLGWSFKGVVWGNAIGLSFSGFLYAVVAWRLTTRLYGATPLSGKWSALRGRRREMLRFLAYNDLTVLVAVIPRELDVLLLGHFRGVVEVSFYKLAKSFGSLTGYIAGPLQSVFYPELVKLSSEVGASSAVNQLIKGVLIKIGIPIGIGSFIVIALVPVVVPALVGQSFLNAVLCTQIFFFASAITLIFFWLRPYFLAKAQYRTWFICSGGVTLLFAVVYPFVVNGFGHNGAALWYLSLQMAGIIVALLFIKSER